MGALIIRIYTLKKIFIIFALLISTSVTAETKGKEYLGLQYGVALYIEPGSPDFNPSFAAIRAGYNLSENFALEFRYGVGNRDDTGTVAGTPVSVGIHNLRGAYFVAGFSLFNTIDPYILAGFTTVKMSTNEVISNEEGISYGGGFTFRGYGKNTSWNIEYINYINDTDVSASIDKSLSSINIGAVILF